MTVRVALRPAAIGLLAALLVAGCGAAPSAPPSPGPAESPTVGPSAPAVDAPTAQLTAEPTAERTAEPAPIPIGAELVAHPIPGHTAYVIEHTAPISANALLYLTPGGVPILADTPWTPAATAALLDWVDARYGRPPALATISHFHLDAAGGIAALQARGVPVVASTHTARLIAERAPAMQRSLADDHGAAFTGWTVPNPDRTFDPATGHRETIDGVEIHVIHPAPAHAPDNVATWIPHAGLLFGGCLVKGGDTLGYLGDADLDRYPAAVAALQALAPTTVVPGHGRRVDAELLAHTANLLAAHAAASPTSPDAPRTDAPPPTR